MIRLNIFIKKNGFRFYSFGVRKWNYPDFNPALNMVERNSEFWNLSGGIFRLAGFVFSSAFFGLKTHWFLHHLSGLYIYTIRNHMALSTNTGTWHFLFNGTNFFYYELWWDNLMCPYISEYVFLSQKTYSNLKIGFRDSSKLPLEKGCTYRRATQL